MQSIAINCSLPQCPLLFEWQPLLTRIAADTNANGQHAREQLCPDEEAFAAGPSPKDSEEADDG